MGDPTYSSEEDDVPLVARKKAAPEDKPKSAGAAETKPRIPKRASTSKPDTSTNVKPAAKTVKKETKPSTKPPSKAKAPAKAPAKSKTPAKEAGKNDADADKKEKKIYDLPGQKRDPPEEGESLRKFYTSLRQQKPESEMAEVWLMEHGLLDADEAQDAFDRQKLRKERARLGPVVTKAKDNGRKRESDDFQDTKAKKKSKR
mmetsp:Transcript_39175/g.47431  ORF Transcript_39175/g.47431 Transcript_39175/m.47431 type:complete len:202 (-) Transcript_39175:553-1158(-)|eukprot:CAMPEP_0197866920 /NCGR_PEP_ID=MMETSP1438-20131217/44478_1 /TAXON_ID=1461541 /ORGANISM="Pterosperma sp., Strain CCMP1384" /LENGTH=201 /DNA_ID=CAMNT_0043485529 /DNA_START=134 /DNA_END=739 /DNA_ORIENTATION=+